MLDSSITSNRKKTVDAESKPEIGAINVDTACGAVYLMYGGLKRVNLDGHVNENYNDNDDDEDEVRRRNYGKGTRVTSGSEVAKSNCRFSG